MGAHYSKQIANHAHHFPSSSGFLNSLPVWYYQHLGEHSLCKNLMLEIAPHKPWRVQNIVSSNNCLKQNSDFETI